MKFEGVYLFDFSQCALAAWDKWEVFKEDLLAHPAFSEMLDKLYTTLGGADGPEEQRSEIEVFTTLCFTMGWFARELAQQETGEAQPMSTQKRAIPKECLQ